MFGKNIMGIIASVLIFIGVCSFAVLVYDYLPDFVKIIGMFAFSAAFIVAGLITSKKHKTAFTYSLLGCGIGTTYISIIATYIVFRAIPSFAVYILLFAWVAGIIALIKKMQYSSILYLVCQVGILFSLVMVQTTEVSVVEYILVCLYTFLSFGLIEMQKRSSSVLTSIGNIFIAFAFILLCKQSLLSPTFYRYTTNPLSLFILVLFAAFVILQLLKLSEWEPTKNHSNVSTIIIFALFLLNLKSTLAPLTNINLILSTIVYSIVLMVMAIILMIKSPHTKLVWLVYIPTNISLLFSTTTLFQLLFPKSTGTLFVVWYTIVLLFALSKKDIKLALSGYIMFAIDFTIITFISIFNSSAYVEPPNFIYLVLLVPIIISFLYIYKNQNSPHINALKLILYIAFNSCIFFFCISLPSNYTYQISILVISITTLCFLVSEYGSTQKNSSTTSKENSLSMLNCVFLFVTNFLFILNLINLFKTSGILYFLILIVTVAQTIVYVPTLYKLYRKKNWFGPFIGIKFTLLILLSFTSLLDLEDIPYFVSFILLLVACACIATGFKKGIASLRIYGLVLTIISVLKLVTFDIYDLNSIVRVLSFIGGGLLCFAISKIYTNADKKLSQKSTKTDPPDLEQQQQYIQEQQRQQRQQQKQQQYAMAVAQQRQFSAQKEAQPPVSVQNQPQPTMPPNNTQPPQA